MKKTLLLMLLTMALGGASRGQMVLSKKGQASLTEYEKYFEENKEAHLKEFSELIAIPSLYSIQANKPDVERAADWIVKKWLSIGMTTAKMMPTKGNPAVYASWEGAKGKPTGSVWRCRTRNSMLPTSLYAWRVCGKVSCYMPIIFC